MYPSVDKIKAVLLKESYISEEDSAAAEKVSHDSEGYVQALIHLEVLTKALLGQALAEAYKLPFADFAIDLPQKENVMAIPEDAGRSMRLVVFHMDDKDVLVATDQPEKIEPKRVKELFPKHKIRLAYTLPEYIDTAFDQYEQPLATRFSDIINTSKRVAPDIVDEIIKDALGFKASDIHFEPHGEQVVVRFRVDGNLREAGVLPKSYYDNILNRISILPHRMALFSDAVIFR